MSSSVMEDKAMESRIQEYSTKLKNLKVTDANELNNLVDQINELNANSACFENKVTEDMLLDIAKLIPPGNDHIISKFSSLIYFLIIKQKVVFHATCIKSLSAFMISAIRMSGEWVLSDLLITLSALLSGNADKVVTLHESLIGKNGVLVQLLIPSKFDESVHFNAFNCLHSLLVKNPGENFIQDDLLNIAYKKCVSFLQVEAFVNNTSDTISLKILISILKCLQQIFISKNVKIENFGELLGILKRISFYGFPGQTSFIDPLLHPTLPCPEMIPQHDSQSESYSSYPKLRKQKRNRRARGKKNHQKKESEVSQSEDDSDSKISDLNCSVSSPSKFSPSSHKMYADRLKSSSSDSEFSDAENNASNLKTLLASARQNAYQTLQAIVKISDKKVMFGYWSSFLPDQPTMPGMVCNQNIFTTVLKDPVPQVRLNALILLAEMLRGSKQFLAHADGRAPRHLSFTSLSSVLATIIREVHRCLLLALLSESSTALLTQILKCYAVLTENVPYSKLDAEILLKLIKQTKSFLHHKDIQVQVACLSVFVSIINSNQIPKEIEDMILFHDFGSVSGLSSKESYMTFSSENSNLPWIIEICQKNVFSEGPLPVIIESLQLLCGIVGRYFNKLISFWHVIERIILWCLNSSETSLQLHGAKLLNVLGRCIISAANTEGAEDLHLSVSKLWLSVLNGPLIVCLSNDTHKTLQSVCCDCLSTLPPKLFQELNSKQQILYITILLGMTCDSNPNVRGASIRCLGVFCLFPTLTQDISFLSDVSESLKKCVDDANVNVRFKASWALGNLSDALFSNRDTAFLCKEISAQFFYSTGMSCVHFSKDCDRIKANAVRALGNFLHYIPKQFIDLRPMQDFIRSSCEALKLALSATFMKVCWNACYALGNVFKNPNLVKHKVIDLDDLLHSLLNILKSPNFKVRISAAQALTVLESRELYGSLLPNVWENILFALSSATEDVNFKEIKHQENLNDQLCYSLCQLASLMTVDDLFAVSNDTIEATEKLLTSMWKFGSHATEDKILHVCNAIEHLTSLSNAEDAVQIMFILQDTLNQAVLAFYREDNN